MLGASPGGGGGGEKWECVVGESGFWGRRPWCVSMFLLGPTYSVYVDCVDGMCVGLVVLI